MLHRLIAILVGLSLLTQVGWANPVQTTSSNVARPQYYIEATYHDQQDEVTEHVRVTIPAKDLALDKAIYFHLYPNAFRKWRFGEEAKPKKPGYIDVTNVKVDQMPTQPVIRETIMKVPLPKSLEKAKNITVEMDVKLRLPHGGTRLNTFKQTAFLAQWYPILAVKDQEGWHIDPYTSVGDPFYTQMSDFEVMFHLPKGYRVISTAKDHQSANAAPVVLKQRNVRDFVAVLTKDYQVKRDKFGNINVNLWYLKGMEDVSTSLLKTAVTSMEFFTNKFGPYPYQEVDVVLGETGFGIAGMEYPGLVTSIPKLWTEKGESPAVNVVAHELAHQWWYGVVGNNQVKEPWLDEGLTTFSEFLYMQEKMKVDDRPLLKKASHQTDKIHQAVGITSVESLYRYPDSIYGLMVYIRPAAMLFQLCDQIGKDKVIQILSTYYQQYRYRIATTADFIRIANQVAKRDLTPFFDKWLYFKEQSTKKAG